MLGPMGSAVVNPAFVTMGQVFHKTPVVISYGKDDFFEWYFKNMKECRGENLD